MQRHVEPSSPTAALPPISAQARSGAAPAHSFPLTGEGSAADCLTTAAALLLLPSEAGAPLLPAGWRELARRTAQLIQACGPGDASKDLRQLQLEVRAYLSERLGDWHPADQQAGVDALLRALCTEEGAGAGAGAPLPPYRLALRSSRACSACTFRQEGSTVQRELYCVELGGGDVAATDSVLHSNPKLFDLQKCLWGCGALHGGSAATGAAGQPCPAPACKAGVLEERVEATSLPQWLVVMLK